MEFSHHCAATEQECDSRVEPGHSPGEEQNSGSMLVNRADPEAETSPDLYTTVDVPLMNCFVRFMPAVTGLKQKVKPLSYQSTEYCSKRPK